MNTIAIVRELADERSLTFFKLSDVRCISFDPEKQRTPRRTIICRHD